MYKTNRARTLLVLLLLAAVATGSDGTLWALHLTENQRIAWTYQVDGSWGAEPSVVGGTLYIGDNTGTVHAIDAASGKCHWKTTLTSSDPRSRQLFSKASVSDRRVYLGAAETDSSSRRTR